VADGYRFAQLLVEHGVTYLLRELDHGAVWMMREPYDEHTILKALSVFCGLGGASLAQP
jgi:hypothetical protein